MKSKSSASAHHKLVNCSKEATSVRTKTMLNAYRYWDNRDISDTGIWSDISNHDKRTLLSFHPNKHSML